jgi:hypothetical protein
MKEAVTGVTGKRIFIDQWVYIDQRYTLIGGHKLITGYKSNWVPLRSVQNLI